ncbi:hypothetical protein D3C87_1420100 [compost metagenome]
MLVANVLHADCSAADAVRQHPQHALRKVQLVPVGLGQLDEFVGDLRDLVVRFAHLSDAQTVCLHAGRWLVAH